jgi:beta-N-acetylhexosaminidase
MASELRAVGVDISLAPVLDLAWGRSEVIGDRAFHREPAAVADLAHAYIEGMRRAGMAATGKHFPGHGWVTADSHTAVPEDPRHLEDLWFSDLVPFERLVHAGLAAVMPAHVIYPRVDTQPPGFSAYWLQQVLRQRLGFQGVVFSDDLSMEGARVAGDLPERARAALQAGCDMVLVCNNRAGAVRVLDALAGYADPVAQSRLVRLHGRHGQSWSALHQDRIWQQTAQAILGLDPPRSLDLV